MSPRSRYTFEPERFSRDWWLRRVRNALWVALISLLVWIYADLEFTDEMELRATIRLVTNPAGRLILRSTDRVEVSFTVQGRRGSLERLEQQLRVPGATVDYEVHEGEGELDTRDLLNRAPRIYEEGLTVLSARPATIRVNLDRLVDLPGVPVALDYTGAIPTGQPKIEPAQVRVEVASADLPALKALPSLRIKTAPVDLKKVKSGEPFTANLSTRIGEVDVRPHPSTVGVTVEIGQLTETEEVTVGVQVVVPPEWIDDGTWRQYTLTRRDRHEWRVQIQVLGPRRDLDQLKAATILAYIVLTDDDKKPVSWLTREVQVRLPQGLDVKLVAPPPPVHFKLEKLPATPPP
jgi:hypothetical protein